MVFALTTVHCLYLSSLSLTYYLAVCKILIKIKFSFQMYIHTALSVKYITFSTEKKSPNLLQ